MQPPELYILEPPKLDLQKMNADADRSAEAAKEGSQKVKDLGELAEGIKEAVRINRSISQRLAKKK